ncbi:MAG TPA: hypothetical protein PLL77_16215, partial [Pyrinomonadaceae bacterium]|nr:hypothetical protein [Pyrinomonadaceae bacterium]
MSAKVDSDIPEKLWITAFQGGAELVWGPIVYAAAEELAKGIGSKLGEAIGQELADALFGSDDDANAQFQAEVLQRLTRIEAKLDQIINFLRTELPELVRGIVKDELISAEKIDLVTASTSVGAIIAQWRSGDRPTESQLDLLEKAGLDAARAGERLLLRGQACHLAGTHGLASLMSACARLGKRRKSSLRSLGFYAKRYAALIQGWIDPNVAGS